MEKKPVVYILHGDDEYAIEKQIASMEAKMGDSSTAEVNTTRLAGNDFTLQALISTANTAPFIAERRIVILMDPLSEIKNPGMREKFKSILEGIPQTTAVVLAIHRPLVRDRDKGKGKRHWLQKWADGQEGRVFEREFRLPRGPQMINWIQTCAIELGGSFNPQAAAMLANRVHEDPRAAAQEIEKLLAYVNYQRPIEPDDVRQLTPYSEEGDVFKMVDAIGARDGPLALRMLRQLLEVDEPLGIFGMVVRQFRLLILTQEMLNEGRHEGEIMKQLKVYPFVARKLIGQVRNFTLDTMEEIFQVLLDTDVGIKTGQVPAEVALDTLITSLTK